LIAVASGRGVAGMVAVLAASRSPRSEFFSIEPKS
jgi:hypothetical protein